MAVSSGKLWHKPSERSPWMQRFVVVNGPSLRVYHTREEFHSMADPMYDMELFSDSKVNEGSDNILKMGSLDKKGMMKWSQRWCLILKTGYLQYTDPDLKAPRLLDLFEAKIEQLKKNLTITIRPKGERNSVFRCQSAEQLNEWFTAITETQKGCARVRRAAGSSAMSSASSAGADEPTLFPITLQRTQEEYHFFCCSDESQMQMWCITLETAIKAVDSSRTSIAAKPARADPSTAGRVSMMASSMGKRKSGAAQLSDEELAKAMEKIMTDLGMTGPARATMLALPRDKQEMLIDQHKSRSKVKATHKQRGSDWASKFSRTSHVNVQLMQQFCVVLRDESPDFVMDFIHELGLKSLCKLATAKKPTVFERELLHVFLCIVDTPGTLQSLVHDEHAIRAITSKIENRDKKIRENCLRILVTLAADESDDGLLAAHKIYEAMNEEAKINGQRNAWLSLIKNLSAKNSPSDSSALYDLHAITLINFMLATMEPELRPGERRLLGALQIDKALETIKDKATRRKIPFAEPSDEEIQSLLNQIDVYQKLAAEDSRAAKVEGYEETDFSNPREVFEMLHDQSLKDSTINELTQILTNLLTLPESARVVWHNIARVVGVACKPTQDKILAGSSVSLEVRKEHMSRSSTVLDTGLDASGGLYYPSYTELSHFLRAHASDPAAQRARSERAKMEKIQKENLQLEEELRKANLLIEELKNAPPKTIEVIREVPAVVDSKTEEASGGTKVPPASEAGADPKAALMGMIAKRGGGDSSAAGSAGAKSAAASAGAAAASSSSNSSPAVDPYAKYRKMQKIKMPAPSIANKMRQDKIDPTVIEEFEESGNLPPAPAGSGASASASSAGGGASAASAVAIVDPYAKYRKMQKIRMPTPSIANKMRQDKIDPTVIEAFEESGNLPPAPAGASASSASGGGGGALPPPPGAAAAASKPASFTAEEEEKLTKFKKMKKMGMPEMSIRNAMEKAKLDPGLIDRFFGGGAAIGAGAAGGAAKKKKEKKPEVPPGMNPKKEMKPSLKMRNVHWTKIDPYTLEKTIWKDLCYSDEKLRIEWKPFEQAFAAKATKVIGKSSGGAGGSSSSSDDAPDKISILDGKRSYNVEIFLGRVKMDNWSIRDALLKFDDSVFDLAMIQKLRNFVPTPEEAAQIAEYESASNLAGPEEFFRVVKSVDTNVVQRLELWDFRLQFDSLVGTQEERITILCRTVTAIRGSARLKKMMTYILAFGNYMNGDTKKGKAFGYKLSTFQQLTRSKTTDNTSHLLEYICLYLTKKDADVLKLTDDLGVLDLVVTVDIPSLRKDVSMIKSRLNMIKSRLDKVASSPSTLTRGDQFEKVFGRFYANASGSFDTLQKKLNQSLKDVNDTAKWLSEDKDQTGVYLRTLNEFRKDILSVKKKMKQREEAEAQKALRSKGKKKKQFAPDLGDVMAATAKLKSSSSSKSKTVSDANLKKATTGTSEDLLSRLKARSKLRR